MKSVPCTGDRCTKSIHVDEDFDSNNNYDEELKTHVGALCNDCHRILKKKVEEWNRRSWGWI